MSQLTFMIILYSIFQALICRSTWHSATDILLHQQQVQKSSHVRKWRLRSTSNMSYVLLRARSMNWKNSNRMLLELSRYVAVFRIWVLPFLILLKCRSFCVRLQYVCSSLMHPYFSQVSNTKLFQALTYIDERVERLERSLEIALNSIYTLVQLQTGMTSSVNRLREDFLKNFTELRTRIDRSISPRRNSRSSRIENSINSGSCSRDRSRSPL